MKKKISKAKSAEHHIWTRNKKQHLIVTALNILLNYSWGGTAAFVIHLQKSCSILLSIWRAERTGQLGFRATTQRKRAATQHWRRNCLCYHKCEQTSVLHECLLFKIAVSNAKKQRTEGSEGNVEKDKHPQKQQETENREQERNNRCRQRNNEDGEG